MPDNLFIPQPTDMVTPAMNLYKLMQQKKEFELQQQQQNSLQDYHKQMGLQNKIQNIISLAKDQPEAAAQMFNSDPEMVQRNNGPIKFNKTEGDWHEFTGGDALYKINRKSGEMKKAEMGTPKAEPKNEFQTFSEGYLKSNPNASGVDLVTAYKELNNTEKAKKNSPTEVRQWHSDAKSTLDDFVGTLTAMGIVIDDKKAEQYAKALALLEKKRGKGLDPSTAAAEVAKEAGLITSDTGVMDTMPPAGQHTGKIIKDTKTGKRLKSDGKAWVEIK